jgi:predicted ribosome quality control (RQC) complex YloA/Tae2 family protein
LVRAIRQMAERFDSPDNGYLYETGGRLEVYPFKLTAFEAQPEKYRSLSLAVLEMTTRRQARVEQADEEKMVLSAVSRTVKRLERRLSNIESDVEKAADYERYRRLGELLQIHLPELKKGMDSITLPDAYSESGEKVKIGLDPALTPSENVEAYFRKHRKGREGLALLRRRKEITFDELAQARRMQQELEIDFEPARQKYRTEIESLLPGATDKKHAAPRLPYKEYTLSSGVTIFVGREGADNDRTTFEFARPYELWFHAQQCPGSHVVMKFPNKSFKPSKSEIEETAACAAWHSKARNDSLVPVIYAERRYVRKPRRARPGLVTVQREKSVMVEPKAPG